MSDDERSGRVARTLSLALTHEATHDPYDHEISMVDTTDPDHDPHASRPARPATERKSTRKAVRDRMQQRRYAKYQESRYSFSGSSINTERGMDSDVQPTRTETRDPTPPPQPKGKVDPGTETVDFARGSSVAEGESDNPVDPINQLDRLASKLKKTKPKPEFEIDILYENQRGSFLCGIPFYSHSSLLQFDPSPWITKDLKTSAVNITNAQVPDPSWEWAWKSWYVDMGGDVDEEGWQYSFMFGGGFAWHGSHPWFHSFARRRRWLRKRVKKDPMVGKGALGAMDRGHHLTGDYFTIHPRRDRSPGSITDANPTLARAGSVASCQEDVLAEIPPEDIKDVPSLMQALHLAKIDREKIDLVKRFVDQGGDELAYLGKSIPEITSLLIYQNSRRQLLSYLKKTATDAQEHRQGHENNKETEGEEEKRRIDNLLAAVDAADRQISGLEYWSDRRHILQTADAEAEEIKAIATIFDEPAPKPDSEDDPVDAIRGISNRAEIYSDRTTNFPQHKQQSTSEDEEQRSAKDKGKAKEQEEKPEPPPRLGTDQVLIPDDDDPIE